MRSDLKWLDAIEKVLDEEKKPLHYSEIADLIVEKGYRKSVGATPASSVNSNLSTDIKDNGSESKFVKVQVGTFTLKKYLDQIDSEDEIDTSSDNEASNNSKVKSIILSYGIAWNRDQVLWKTSPDLFGVQTFGATPVNFQKQIGVYLLYDGREIIYIGQAISQTIGERLYQHTKDRISGRWDRFSWFGLLSVSEKGNLEIIEEKSREITIGNIGDTLEAILIESIEPRQNRKSGNKFSGLEYNQHEDPEIVKKRTQQILEELKSRI